MGRAGKADAAGPAVCAGARIKGADLEAHADAILGIYRHEVVTAFAIEGWTRSEEERRDTFAGRPSQRWAHLVGVPNPGSAGCAGKRARSRFCRVRELGSAFDEQWNRNKR